MRTSRILAYVAFLSLALALGGCKKVGTETPPLDTRTPVPAPADLLVEASLAKLKGGLAGAGAYADRVQPGMSGLVDAQVRTLLAGAVGLVSLDGAKDDQPVRLLVLDPKKAGRRNALLVGVGDEKKLREAAKAGAIRVQDGQALIGDKAAVEALASYAFATLAKKPPAATPGGVLYVPALLASYKDDIAKAREQMKTMFAAKPEGGASLARMLDMEFDGVLGLLERSDAIEVRIEASADIAGLDIAFVPKAGSDLEAFVKAQKPASNALLARLPARATPPTIVVIGHVELGPLRAKLRPFLEDMMAQIMGITVDDETRAAFDTWLDTFNGELAMVGDMGVGGMRLTELAGATDGAKAMESGKSLFAKLIGKEPRTIEVMGMKTTFSGSLEATTYDGIKFVGYDSKTDLSGLPAEVAEAQRKVYGGDPTMHVVAGGWDDVVGVVMGPDATKQVPALVDASRGKAPRLELAPGVTKLLDDSRARGESLAYVMNLGGLMAAFTGATPPSPASSGLVFGLGFQGGRAHLRFALPADHLLEIKRVIGGVAH